MPFTASDGREFETRKEWREYEMALRYSFANQLIIFLNFEQQSFVSYLLIIPKVWKEVSEASWRNRRPSV